MKKEYDRVRKIIDDYFRLIRRVMTGEGSVPSYVLKRLKLQEKKIQGLMPQAMEYGKSLFPDGKGRANAASWKKQLEGAQIRTDLALDNLRTKMLQTVQNALFAGAGAAAGAAVFAAAAGALRNRRQQFTSDWSRTAQTEMHNAKESGASLALSTYVSGDDTKVYKICQPDACDRCIAAYQNADGSPKIFTLGELRRNGSNEGRKAAEWLPVIGCLHPHCKCTLELAE